MAELRENVIEWIDGMDTVSVTFTQRKYINKIKKLAQKHDEVDIVKENEDGTLFAHVPLSYIKISAPRFMSEEQRRQAGERLRTIKEKEI